jgi:predicted molibdopterin-dependent oxidoreductase YjgC
MFRRLAPTEALPIDFEVDGKRVTARAGESVAAALLNAGRVPLRHTPISGAPRAPLCMMGVCFDCLVQIDGQASVQACMVPVRTGMRVRTQHEARRVEADDGA